MGQAARADRQTPIFILGFPRSGTTLLRLMLNAHPAIAIPPESMYLERLVRRFGDRTCSKHEMSAIAAVIHPYNRWSLDMDRVMDAIEQRLPAHVSEIAAAVYQNWGEQMGKSPRFWGSKEPWRIQHLERLVRWYPSAYFFHIYRDPRDCIVSRLEHYAEQVPLRSVLPPELILACHWQYLVRRCRRIGRRLAPRRYLEVKYEHLVQAPEACLRWLVAILGLSFDRCMLEYAKATTDPRVLPLPERRSRAHDNVAQAPTTARVGRYKESLAEWRLAAVESICRGPMQELGYRFEKVPTTRLFRPLAFVYRVVFDISYAFWRTTKRMQKGL